MVPIMSIAKVSISGISSVPKSSIPRNTSMSIINTGDHSNIMGVASGIGIVYGKSMVDLGNSVGIRLGVRVSLSFPIVSVAIAGISMMSIAGISSVTNSSISSNMSMSIIHPCDHSNVMRVASSIGIVYRESMVDLTKSVSIGI